MNKLYKNAQVIRTHSGGLFDPLIFYNAVRSQNGHHILLADLRFLQRSRVRNKTPSSARSEASHHDKLDVKSPLADQARAGSTQRQAHGNPRRILLTAVSGLCSARELLHDIDHAILLSWFPDRPGLAVSHGAASAVQ